MIGIVLGLILGVGIVAGFVLLGSEDTIDAPRINEAERSAPAPAEPGRADGGRAVGAEP